MAETLFQKIIAGTIPSYKVYEDEMVYAFLDVQPLSKGHTLVVPKEPAQTLDQLSDQSAAAIGKALPRICRAVMRATGTQEYNILQNNGAGAHQVVGHVHFHIIPKPNTKDGLGIHWPATQLEKKEAEHLLSQIHSAL